YPVVLYLLIYLVIITLFFYTAGLLTIKLIIERSASKVWVNLIYLPLIAAIFFLGIRGRIEEKAPLRWGVAYFSEYDFANQLALNPNFTFFKDVIYNAGKQEQVKKLMDDIHISDAGIVARQMLGIEQDSTGKKNKRIVSKVHFKEQNKNPPNVILIVMESFGSTRIGALKNRWEYNLSPCFDAAVDKGILFTNFYSNGMHTYTGLFCSLYGYPHLFGKLIMKQVMGRYHFQGLPTILKKHDYKTFFFTTHDPHFDNMQGFFKANGIEKIFSLLDYDKKEKLSTLGVPDHVIFERALKELRQLKGKRFFATLLTASNHGPWSIPDVPFVRIPENEKQSEQLNAFKYSDWALGQFLNVLDRDPSFNNTIVVITADNGNLYKARLDLDLTQFQIPLLIYNTDWKQTKRKLVNRLGSQMDIPATVMGLIKLDYDNYTFGHDLLDSNTDTTINDFVHLSEWYKVGYIENGYYHINRMQGPESLYKVDDITIDLSDSLVEMNREYARKALSLYQTAYNNMLLSLDK
ncbi:MAG: LTA synthase family protein, partial [Candidatus Zixiibacteriota bacterium]